MCIEMNNVHFSSPCKQKRIVSVIMVTHSLRVDNRPTNRRQPLPHCAGYQNKNDSLRRRPHAIYFHSWVHNAREKVSSLLILNEINIGELLELYEEIEAKTAPFGYQWTWHHAGNYNIVIQYGMFMQNKCNKFVHVNQWRRIWRNIDEILQVLLVYFTTRQQVHAYRKWKR